MVAPALEDSGASTIASLGEWSDHERKPLLPPYFGAKSGCPTVVHKKATRRYQCTTGNALIVTSLPSSWLVKEGGCSPDSCSALDSGK